GGRHGGEPRQRQPRRPLSRLQSHRTDHHGLLRQSRWRGFSCGGFAVARALARPRHRPRQSRSHPARTAPAGVAQLRGHQSPAEPLSVPQSRQRLMAAQWPPRMQQVAEEICRYALETGEMPTLMEIARRIGLSRERTGRLWARIERGERPRRLDLPIHIKRQQMGYLLAVLKDIERAARKAALGW